MWKKIAIRVAMLVAAILLILGVSSCGTAKTISVEGYVYDPCGGCFSANNPCKPCTVVKELESYLHEKAAKYNLEGSLDINVYNTLFDENKEKLEESLGREPDTENYPIVFVDNTVLVGWEEIESELLRTIDHNSSTTEKNETSKMQLEVKETAESMAIYFKTEGCGQCKKTEELLDSAEKGEHIIETYDISDNSSYRLLEAYAEKYNLQAEEILVPIIFVGDSVLEGYDEIETFLFTYLEEGKGCATPR